MNSVIAYFRESYDELMNRVTWPTAKELQKGSIATGVASLLIALLISMMDMSGNALFNDFIYKLIK